ncbi:SDR family NAD(P)-dependent oxidoreductase [Streptomyces flavidovirens]|uniref:SDR family NAD(P)-dependent oxidoreductase n=1 Tax=Streptomyces flavidovirens TaxID=67298 RepID=UPI0034307793
MEQLTAEDWDRTFQTNVYACFHLVMAALPHAEAGDVIIATATEEAFKGSTTMIDYAASKAALIPSPSPSPCISPSGACARTWWHRGRHGRRSTRRTAHAAGRTRPDRQRGTPGPCRAT